MTRDRGGIRRRPRTARRTPTLLAAALLGVVLAPPTVLGEVAEPVPPPPPTIDARALYTEAEGRTFRLSRSGLSTFSCLVSSPFVDKLSEPGAPLDGRHLRFTLWWRAPATLRVTLTGDGGALPPEQRSRLLALFEPLGELLLPRPPGELLAAHDFRLLQEGGAGAGDRVIEALAREPGDERRRARFRIGPDGLVAEEAYETAAGELSRFRTSHADVAGRQVITTSEGTFRGAPVRVDLEWGVVQEGRPLPTRVTVRQFDASGQTLPGALGTMTFRLSEHRLDPVVPEDVLASPAAVPGR